MVLRNDLFNVASLLRKSTGGVFVLNSEHFLTFRVPRFLDIIPCTFMHPWPPTKMLAHLAFSLLVMVLEILISAAMPHANMLHRSDRVEHEREVNIFNCLCANPMRSGDKF